MEYSPAPAVQPVSQFGAFDQVGDRMVGHDQPPRQNQIRQGVEAYARIESERNHTWGLWRQVIIALALIDALAMREAGTNSPQGGKFNQAVAKYLRCYGLDRIHKSDRSRMRKYAGKLDAIDAWRNAQSPERQLELNSPRVVFNHWERSLRSTPEQTKEKAAKSASAKTDPVADVLAILGKLTDAQLTRVWTGLKLGAFLRTIPADMRAELERRITGLHSRAKTSEPSLLRQAKC